MPTCFISRSIIKPLDDRQISDISKSADRNIQMDLWSSILSGKDSKTDLDSPPYIHPMAKRSLTDESLEICTESLGSETGSDGFSPAAAASNDELGSDFPRCSSPPRIKNGGYRKRSDLPLPPPLPSLSLQMRSRRQDGRLVMEAVSVAPFESCFEAERQDGRLLLKLSDHSPSDEETIIQEIHDVADRDDDVSGQDDDVAEVTSSVSLTKLYVYEYLRNKLQPCRRTLLLMLKETTALPILSNI